MKLFQRRIRLSKGSAVFFLFFGAFATFALYTGELIIPRGRVGTTRYLLEQEDHGGFWIFTSAFIVLAFAGLFFTFYQFREGSWFNPRR